jgi:hypothetical protein
MMVLVFPEGFTAPFGATELGATAFGLTAPFGVTVVPELTLPGAGTVAEPALFGTMVLLLFMPLFICRTWFMQVARRPGSRLWQLVPGG